MTEHNLDQLLQQLDPVRGQDVPGPDSRRARAIRDRAMGRRRRPSRLIAVAAAVLVLAGATAGAVVWFSDEPTDPAIACFAAADLEADRINGVADVGTGTVACEPLWTGGVLGDELPELIACVLDGGAIGVFPGNQETCATLGLPVAADAGRAVAPELELRQRLTDALVVDPCLPPAAGVEVAETLLAELDLVDDGWTVDEITPQIDEPLVCATGSVDTERRVVAITAAPDFNN